MSAYSKATVCSLFNFIRINFSIEVFPSIPKTFIDAERDTVVESPISSNTTRKFLYFEIFITYIDIFLSGLLTKHP